MLQIKEISKKYQTGDLIQTALDRVSINLRDNEFVAILGPSGSGKTTLLNIIGGLDRYDSGDLIINSKSTKKYNNRDWDSYRNHTIGFIFQSYNLIPHQTILSNVELALTISGISKDERKKKAKQALTDVGLADHIHKRPNQLSGGQMQRVAIARALVNDPDILLADEPTGALDTDTSVQVMDLLKEVAKDRLVVMVTHNPELSDNYATRVIKLRDGKVIDDSDPFEIDDKITIDTKHKNMGKSSMSLFTSFALSFNNLRTKKGRTFLTAFAGSIGITGIALILALSSGVNTYIEDIQKTTMVSYPITIDEQSIDFSTMIETGSPNIDENEVEESRDGVFANAIDLEVKSTITSNVSENNLTKFKKYLEDTHSDIHEYIGENGIVYSYDTQFNAYSYDEDDTLVNSDGSTLSKSENSMAMGIDPDTSPALQAMGMANTSNNFEQLMPGTGDNLISPVVLDNYDVVYGEWPSKYNEVVLILDKNNEVSLTSLYELGMLPSKDYKDIMERMDNGEKIEIDTKKYSYKDIAKQSFYLVTASDTFTKDKNGLFNSLDANSSEIEKLFDDSLEIKISGIVRLQKDSDYNSIMNPIGYTQALTNYIIDHTNDSPVVKAQEKNPKKNILSGVSFKPGNKENKIKDTKSYIDNLDISNKAKMARDIMGSNPVVSSQLMSLSEVEIAAMFDNYLTTADDDSILTIYDKYISSGSFDENMEAFGVISLDSPSSISIYTDSFEDKDGISAGIEAYNKDVEDKDQITYTDTVGLLMSSVTTIVDVISYVLIAFVAVSLIVSSIMIGIITFISVLERTKEIGILRAIGASKNNISQVFNAETFIIGLLSGIIGIVTTILLTFPINAIIYHFVGNDSVNATLPFGSAIILIILSVILTLIGGIIPSKKAAKQDPVIALRME